MRSMIKKRDNFRDEIVGSDEVRARFGRFLLLLAARDRQHTLGLAHAVRKNDGAANHLIGVLRIDAQPERQLDGLVELGELHFLYERDRIFDRVEPIGCNLRPCGLVLLAASAHV